MRRTFIAEYASAWRLAPTDTVLGFVAEMLLIVGIQLSFGGTAALVFVGQAGWSFVLNAAVNYFQHWGLARNGREHVAAGHSWDSDSVVTRYALLGLAHHSEHHAYPARSFGRLNRSDGAPALPHGHLRMVFLVLLRDRLARGLMTKAIDRELPVSVR